MNHAVDDGIDSGLEVVAIDGNVDFASRHVHTRDAALQMRGLERIASCFVQTPETILAELVNAAVELCGADSAGISVIKEDPTDSSYYHWVATAGDYSGFLDAVLPRYPSACGICLERGRPQHFRVGQRFFNILGVSASVVTDGILLPWQVEQREGTIFIMAHGRAEAFDLEDCRMMELLANFAAMGVRQQKQQKLLTERASASAAAAMANQLAHKINNPLQSLTNLLYLAGGSRTNEHFQELARQAAGDLDRLSLLVKQLLALPYAQLDQSRLAPWLEESAVRIP